MQRESSRNYDQKKLEYLKIKSNTGLNAGLEREKIIVCSFKKYVLAFLVFVNKTFNYPQKETA